ncbi:MAG: N-acetylmuramoyl-L-alanine amidase [Phycisphaerae bacterium]|nr:N-acetylmuramoyl-L-alanine amidase [Phycisphaerae bacterium]
MGGGAGADDLKDHPWIWPMMDAVDHQPTRRNLLTGGLFAAGSLVLWGCGGKQVARGTPGVLWPDERALPTPRGPMVPLGANSPTAASSITGPAAGPSPRVAGVMPRSSWTSAQPILRLADPMGSISRVTVHHDGMPPVTLRSQAEVARRIEQIRKAHVTGRGWADIGYHYVIDPTGRVWEGRPLRLQGAHVQDNNPGNMGVLVMGNFDEQSPTSAAREALDAFLADQVMRYRVPVSRVYTHQELKRTACPGRNLQRYMLDTRTRSGRLGRMLA